MLRFPRTRYVQQNDLKMQMDHATSELLEVMTAIDAEEPTKRVVEEIFDCIHSLETALRIAQEKHGIMLNEISAFVVMKNELRGYYDC